MKAGDWRTQISYFRLGRSEIHTFCRYMCVRRVIHLKTQKAVLEGFNLISGGDLAPSLGGTDIFFADQDF